MNKLCLSVGLALTAFAAKADLLTPTFTNTTALAPTVIDVDNLFTGAARPSPKDVSSYFSFNNHIVLTVERADYEATRDTNITLRVARVYSLMRTNVEVLPNLLQGRMSCAVIHPPGTVCEWDNKDTWPSTEVTAISKDRIAEIDGKQFVLDSTVISRTERTFILKTTPAQVYVQGHPIGE